MNIIFQNKKNCDADTVWVSIFFYNHDAIILQMKFGGSCVMFNGRVIISRHYIDYTQEHLYQWCIKQIKHNIKFPPIHDIKSISVVYDKESVGTKNFIAYLRKRL